MYVKAFIVNVNKRLKPFFLEQHINIVNRVTLQCFWISLGNPTLTLVNFHESYIVWIYVDLRIHAYEMHLQRIGNVHVTRFLVQMCKRYCKYFPAVSYKESAPFTESSGGETICIKTSGEILAIRTSIAKRPYSLLIFQGDGGGGSGPMRPPSVSAHE